MKISIISYAFHGLLEQGRMDLFGYLESVRYRYGLDAADIWNGSLASLERDYLAKVKGALAERELALANFAVDDAHIWDPDPSVREQLHKVALAHLDAAEFLGARTVRLDTGGEAAPMGSEQFDVTVRRFQEYARRARDGGYRIGPENHWGAAMVPENIRRLQEAVGSPAYGLLLHVGNWKGGDADEADRMAAPFTFHTHFEWGLAQARLEEKMRLLRDAGYEGYWGIEHWSGVNEYHDVAIEVAMMREVLNRWRQQGE